MFRDPRDVVISERRMKIEVYHKKHADIPLPTFIEQRFKVQVGLRQFQNHVILHYPVWISPLDPTMHLAVHLRTPM